MNVRAVVGSGLLCYAGSRRWSAGDTRNRKRLIEMPFLTEG